MSDPKGRLRVFSDQELIDALEAGTAPAEFARQKGVALRSVHERIARLRLTMVAAVVAPEAGKRFVESQIDVMEELTRNLRRYRKLQDACDAWLTDANDSERYDVGARHEEVEVTYEVEVAVEGPRGETRYRTEKRKKTLSQIMSQFEGEDEDGARFIGWKHGEFKRADPRELILKTMQESRATVQLYAGLIDKLNNARAMQKWREVALEEIARESPDCASRIADRLQRSILLHAAFAGPPAAQE